MMYCYRFPDEDTWLALAAAEGLIAEDILIAYTHDHSIDVVGTIRQDGEWDVDGNEIEAPTVLPGWHVNVQGIAPEEWDQYLVYVFQPHRIFAGMPGPVPP